MIEFFTDLKEGGLLLYALLAGIASSFIFGVTGSFVIARRISYIAAAIAHSILGGVGASFFFARTQGWDWCTPLLGAIVAALVSAAIIGFVTLKVKEREDTVITAIWASGMAAGLLFLHFTPGKNVILESYIFGNILLTDQTDVRATIILGLVVLILVSLFYHKLVAVCFDEEFSRLRGVHTKLYYFLLLAIVAISMVLLVRLAGIILSIALIVLPAATAARFSRRLWLIMIIAVVISLIYNVGGLAFSYVLDVPTGPFIVVISCVIYCLSFLYLRRKA